MTRNILIIDDNVELLDMLSLILTRHFYQVTVKNRLVKLEDEIIQTEPDVILLDKHLGWGNGVTICKAIKSHPHFSKIPVIMFSGYSLHSSD